LRAIFPEPCVRRDTGPRIPSLHEREVVVPTTNAKPRYFGEMAERERKAQEEIARKRKCIAPAYNKGAYQYITPETDPKTIGRK